MSAPEYPPAARVLPGPGEAVLATWHQLIDTGRMQDGEPFLAGTARPTVAVMSAATASEAGTADGGKVSVTTAQGAITLGVRVQDMPDRVVWLPQHSSTCTVHPTLGVTAGAVVTLDGGEPG
jgi:NADH-quinone oxidoreductase subunit G